MTTGCQNRTVGILIVLIHLADLDKVIQTRNFGQSPT